MKRNILDDLLRWRASPGRKPLILRGARQVGKTHSLREFGASHFQKTHYLNFEKQPGLARVFDDDLSPRQILSRMELELNCSIDIAHDLLILDEIQDCPLALTALKYFCEELPGMAVCAAGSLLGLELSPGSFPVGKVEFLSMFPMSFEEFLSATGDEPLRQELFSSIRTNAISATAHDHLWQRMLQYLITGGLPEVVAAFAVDPQPSHRQLLQVREIQEDLITAYHADMAKHSGKQNSVHLERLWRGVSVQLASTEDGGAEKFRFKDVIPGVGAFSRMAGAIDWLRTAGLIIQVPVVSSASVPLLTHRRENRFKLMMFDIGLLGAMANIAPAVILAYGFGAYKGFFMENFVAQELHCAGLGQIYAWNEGASEIEFLLETGGEVVPLEVKAGRRSRSRSLGVYDSKYKPKAKFIANALPFNRAKEDERTKIFPLYLTGGIWRHVAGT